MKMFKRIKNIFDSNVNSALDKMEDPSKMIRLMITQMDDSLVEAKATVADNLANIKRRKAEKETIEAAVKRWESRAELAVEKGKDNLAREALTEKKKALLNFDAIEKEIAGLEEILNGQYAQVSELEKKLLEMKNKEHLLVARAVRAKEKKKIAEQIHSTYNNNIAGRFSDLESKIERLEADAEVAGFHSTAVEGEFDKMEKSEEIENELKALKAKQKKDAKEPKEVKKETNKD